MENTNIQLQCCIFGDANCGKTTLLQSLKLSQDGSNGSGTGLSNSVETSISFMYDELYGTLQLSAFAHSQTSGASNIQSSSVMCAYYERATICIVMFNCQSRLSYQHALGMMEQIPKHIPIVLVGSKYGDGGMASIVSEEELQKICKAKHRLIGMFIDSKSGYNISQLRQVLLELSMCVYVLQQGDIAKVAAQKEKYENMLPKIQLEMVPSYTTLTNNTNSTKNNNNTITPSSVGGKIGVQSAVKASETRGGPVSALLTPDYSYLSLPQMVPRTLLSQLTVTMGRGGVTLEELTQATVNGRNAAPQAEAPETYESLLLGHWAPSHVSVTTNTIQSTQTWEWLYKVPVFLVITVFGLMALPVQQQIPQSHRTKDSTFFAMPVDITPIKKVIICSIIGFQLFFVAPLQLVASDMTNRTVIITVYGVLACLCLLGGIVEYVYTDTEVITMAGTMTPVMKSNLMNTIYAGKRDLKNRVPLNQQFDHFEEDEDDLEVGKHRKTSLTNLFQNHNDPMPAPTVTRIGSTKKNSSGHTLLLDEEPIQLDVFNDSNALRDISLDEDEEDHRYPLASPPSMPLTMQTLSPQHSNHIYTNNHDNHDDLKSSNTLLLNTSDLHVKHQLTTQAPLVHGKKETTNARQKPIPVEAITLSAASRATDPLIDLPRLMQMEDAEPYSIRPPLASPVYFHIISCFAIFIACLHCITLPLLYLSQDIAWMTDLAKAVFLANHPIPAYTLTIIITFAALFILTYLIYSDFKYNTTNVLSTFTLVSGKSTHTICLDILYILLLPFSTFVFFHLTNAITSITSTDKPTFSPLFAMVLVLLYICMSAYALPSIHQKAHKNVVTHTIQHTSTVLQKSILSVWNHATKTDHHTSLPLPILVPRITSCIRSSALDLTGLHKRLLRQAKLEAVCIRMYTIFSLLTFLIITACRHNNDEILTSIVLVLLMYTFYTVVRNIYLIFIYNKLNAIMHNLIFRISRLTAKAEKGVLTTLQHYSLNSHTRSTFLDCLPLTTLFISVLLVQLMPDKYPSLFYIITIILLFCVSILPYYLVTLYTKNAASGDMSHNGVENNQSNILHDLEQLEKQADEASIWSYAAIAGLDKTLAGIQQHDQSMKTAQEQTQAYKALLAQVENSHVWPVKQTLQSTTMAIVQTDNQLVETDLYHLATNNWQQHALHDKVAQEEVVLILGTNTNNIYNNNNK